MSNYYVLRKYTQSKNIFPFGTTYNTLFLFKMFGREWETNMPKKSIQNLL